MQIFRSGMVDRFERTNGVLDYKTKDLIIIYNKVIPFYEKYVLPHCSPYNINRVQAFKKLVGMFLYETPFEIDTMLYSVLPLWDSVRVQISDRKHNFKSLQEAQEHVKQAYYSSS